MIGIHVLEHLPVGDGEGSGRHFLRRGEEGKGDEEGFTLERNGEEMRSCEVGDFFAKERCSWVMSRITGKDTRPERLLRTLLHRYGFRFTVNGPLNKTLPGRSDIVLPKHETIIMSS